MAENFTTATQVDPNSHINAASSTQLVISALRRNETAYAYWDKGAGYYAADFMFHVNFTAATAAADGSGMYFWGLANSLNSLNSVSDMVGLHVYKVSATDYRIALYERDGGTEYNNGGSTALDLTEDATYYCKVWRDESVGTYGTIYAQIFSDSSYTTQVGSTLSIALHTSMKNYRYLYATSSRNTGAADAFTGTIYQLEEVTWIRATDTLTLTDGVVFPFKTFTITDTLTLTDIIVLDDGTTRITITDSLTLTDGVATPAKTISVTDTLALNDSTALQRTITVTDSFTISEVVSAISNNSLLFGAPNFPSGYLGQVEYRIADQNELLIQDWTTTGVLEREVSNGKSTYYIKNILLINGFQGFIEWRIPGTRYHSSKTLNYYESWISTYASLPTLEDIESSNVLAKEATVATRLAATDYIAPDNEGIERILGMLFENRVEDDIVRDASGNKTISILYLYDSAAHAAAHVSGGGGSMGLKERYQCTFLYNPGGRMSLNKLIRL